MGRSSGQAPAESRSRRAYIYGARQPMGAVISSAVVFLAGAWLVIAPFALDYRSTGTGFDAYWNDVLVGVVVALLALVRNLAPLSVPWFSAINIILGMWLICAPFVLGYNDGSDAAIAVANDLTVGVVVAVMALSSALATRAYRKDHTAR